MTQHQAPEATSEDQCRDGSSRLVRSLAHTKHGHKIGRICSPTYQSWQAMLSRTRNLRRDRSNKHIGRGITACDRWQLFENFLEDMGVRPLGKTLDRIDNDGDYEPGNCRWSTPIEQARNRRNAKLNFVQAVEIALAVLAGETGAAVARRYGVSASLPRSIIKGRTWRDALAKAREIVGEN
jgi:hypothetical protein